MVTSKINVEKQGFVPHWSKETHWTWLRVSGGGGQHTCSSPPRVMKFFHHIQKSVLGRAEGGEAVCKFPLHFQN